MKFITSAVLATIAATAISADPSKFRLIVNSEKLADIGGLVPAGVTGSDLVENGGDEATTGIAATLSNTTHATYQRNTNGVLYEVLESKDSVKVVELDHELREGLYYKTTSNWELLTLKDSFGFNSDDLLTYKDNERFFLCYSYNDEFQVEEPFVLWSGDASSPLEWGCFYTITFKAQNV